MKITKKNLPMLLTTSRIFMLPLILILLVCESLWPRIIAVVIIILASLTDYLDGKLARKFDAVTTMGKFMDPIADKIFVSGILIMMIPMGKVPAVIVLILIARDIFIDGIRAVAAVDNIIIAARPFGKWKTAIQMIAIPSLIFDIPLWADWSLADIGRIVLWISVGFSLISAVEYFWGYWKVRLRSAPLS